MLLCVGPEQFEQEAGRQGRKDADLYATVLRTPYGGDILGAIVDMLKSYPYSPEIAFSRQRQVYATMMTLKQGRTKLVLKITDSPADRRFLDAE